MKNISILVILLLGLSIFSCGDGGEGKKNITGDDNSNNSGNTNSGTGANISIESVSIGKPVSSGDGTGDLVGATKFSGRSGFTDIEMLDWKSMDEQHICGFTSCGDRYHRIWLQVNVIGGTVEKYEWKIVGWKNQEPCGFLAYYDRVGEIDIYNGKYVVETNGNNNKIRYESPPYRSITSCYKEVIEVTAFTSSQKYATGSFVLYIRPYGWTVSRCR